MNLERSLVLNRYLHGLFGAERFDDLRRALKEQEEGPGPDGRSRFFHVLSGRSGLKIEARTLEDYDHRIMEYEARLAKKRRAEPFKSFKYFQYLALLYTEVFLDRLTADPAAFLRELNAFRASKADFTEIPDFTADDVRRLAFFMATGSGKTLLLHVNILQILHYLKAGKHPEALVRRSDGRPEFDNILLITPGEGLSAQHLVEFEDSGFDAKRFERNGNQSGLVRPPGERDRDPQTGRGAVRRRRERAHRRTGDAQPHHRGRGA